MSDEDESADPGMTAAEREIFTLLSAREARDSIDYEGTRQNGSTTVSQSPQHPAPANPIKQKKTADTARLDPARIEIVRCDALDRVAQKQKLRLAFDG